MNESEFFGRCKSLVGDTSSRTWDRDSMAGFFQSFRDEPSALRSLLSDVPRGQSVCDRLVQIFDATTGHTRNGRSDLYCVVREPKTTDTADLLSSAATLLENYRQMAIAIDEQELVDSLSPAPNIRLVHSGPPDVDSNDCDSLDVYIYDVQCEWHGNLAPATECARWMSEAFYYINCDYCLAWYANWPWYVDDSTIDDPLLPYFQLWRHGAELRCQTPEDITLYLPDGSGAA